MPSWVSCLGDINLSGEVNEIAESCDQEGPVCSPDEQRLLQTVGEVRMGGVDGEVSVLKKNEDGLILVFFITVQCTYRQVSNIRRTLVGN